MERERTTLVVEPRYLGGLPVRPNILLGFENITYSFPTTRNLTSISCSFEINATEHVAFVGSSGSGKTTVMRLIHRFFDPQIGRVIASTNR